MKKAPLDGRRIGTSIIRHRVIGVSIQPLNVPESVFAEAVTR
jgi:hypothetical protein